MPGRWQTSSMTVLGGGSSSSFRSALAPDGVQLVGRVDDQHLAAAARRGGVQRLVGVADLIDRDVLERACRSSG